MTDRAQALLREALALPTDERAGVAAELLASLDDSEADPADIEAAWAAAIEKRAHSCGLAGMRVKGAARAVKIFRDVAQLTGRGLALTIILAVAISGIAGCGSSPAAPAPVTSTLVIRVGTGTTALKSGDREVLHAILRDSRGGEREVTGAWAVEGSVSAAIDDGNVLAAKSPGAVTVRVTAEGQNASQAVTVFQNVEGVWAGTYKLVDCVRLTGGGSSYCRYSIGVSLYLRLQLVQQGDVLSGQIAMGDNVGNVTTRGSVAGLVTGSGQVQVLGTAESVTEHVDRMEIVAWTSELSPAARMTGQFTVNRTFNNAFGPQTSREVGRLEDLQRGN